MVPIYIFIEYHDLLSRVCSHLFAEKNIKLSLFFSNSNGSKTKSQLCLIKKTCCKCRTPIKKYIRLFILVYIMRSVKIFIKHVQYLGVKVWQSVNIFSQITLRPPKSLFFFSAHQNEIAPM